MPTPSLSFLVVRRAIGLALLASVCFGATPARAHAILLESRPAARASVVAGASHVVLRFNSRVDHARSLLVLKGGPKPVTLAIDPGSAVDAIESNAELVPGRYTLRWQVLATDGHITRGDVPFTVIAK